MTKSEAAVQAEVRVRCSELGWRMFRNNVGVLMDARGVPVRYGLANDSAQINKRIKSADLIGIRSVLITQEMVGTVIGQLVSIECKASDWYPGRDGERERAQMRWLNLIEEHGGLARMIRNVEEL